MKVRNHIFLALLAVAFMASCSEADKTIEFGVDNNSIDIEAVGGTRKVNVSAGENRVATSSAPWITVLPANGRGSKECSLIIDSAITTSPRDGYVLFINTDNNNEYKRVDVSQKGFDYAITLDEPSVNIENYATLDKRYFDVKVKTNVAFNVKVVDEETGAEPSWVDVGQFNVNLDHGRRPREVSLRISWGINSTPMQRNALLSFTPAETDVTSEMLARNDELTINQNAAERIVTGRGGDSIALLGIARSLEVWDSNWESSGEKMDNWDGVVLWEEGMSGYVDSLKGRVKSAEFNSFSTKEGIPYEVQYLTAAEELKFYSNVNTFQLNLSTGPYICELTQLKRLTIGAYGLTELDENFTKLKNLEYLDLSSNNFEQVPAVINPENFPKLHALQMVNNQRLLIYDLSNSISTNFGGLYLHTKYDSAQDTFGEFPTWLLKWEPDAAKGIAGLDTLKLSVNYLQGSIPDFKDDATIGYYDDEDFIRPDTIPAIHVKRVMPQLKMFALNLNRLTGELPEWILYHPALDSALSVVALFAFHACSTEDLVEPSASNTQSEPTEMSGEVIVKFDPAVSDLLDERGLAQTRSNAAATRSGIYSVDEVLDMLGECQLERVFPVDALHEEQTRQAGLHLWYVVRFSDKYSVEEVVNRLSTLGEVQTATPNRTIKRAYRTDRKPIPFPKELLNAPATRAEGENGYVYNDQLLKWEWHMINRGYQDHFTIDPEEDAEVAKAKFQVGADVNCEKAWERTTGDPSIIVAVLDEGIYFRHPDLQYNMWENEGETYGSHKDNDGNGYVGDYYGYDFINNTGIISCDNSADTGHGTHVAGVIAARNNNGIGITSIAGGTEENPGVKIMSCQIFSGNTSSNTVSLARAIKYAADNGAVILQCSWGYTSSTANGYENTPGFATQEEWETNCPLEKASLDYFVHNAGSPNGPIEGGIPVFASGNECAPSAGFPGAADYCVSVNAIAADYTISTFSNYGPGSNISAPGGDQDYYFDYIGSESSDPAYTAARGAVGCVLSTMPPQVSDQTGYGYMEGTSMACPHVSGVAALGLSYAVKLRKHFTAAEFRKLLVESVTPIDDYQTGNKNYYHYVSDMGKNYPKIIPLSQYVGKNGGLVNADKLLAAIEGEEAGTAVTFPNIYLGIGEENAVKEDPARYFVNGESLSYTLKIDNTSVATGEIKEGKAVFIGLKEGVTTASIEANGTVQKFNITVRKTANGNGWL